MCNIKMFSLGGLDEMGKNCYVVEIDKNIYVFDCGLKYANEDLYGIDYIIPDFEYLINNQEISYIYSFKEETLSDKAQKLVDTYNNLLDKLDNTNIVDLTEHVFGNVSGNNIEKLQKYKEVCLNIELMIINDLKDLFMLLW